ncbi:glycosyltransferase family 87 protein [Aeoliella sp. SH292]|uniref:glycosyltransferase family 87 protein n=1 Tax=Aeoliella sp. SH292 TaxID=3454464 RepID=UPI003F9B4D31
MDGREQRVGRLGLWQWLVQLLSLVVIIAGVAGSAWRAHTYHHPPGPYQPKLLGFGDFQNGIYFPAKAFADGVSPYGVEYVESYPVPRPTPLYSPLLFLLHVPIGLLPLTIAEWVYFGLMILMIAGLAWVLVRDAGASLKVWFLPVMAVIVLSRAGMLTLFSGYFTFELAIGVALALSFARTRPWLSGVGMMFASLKPTFIIPLTLLMLARRDWQAAWRGVLLSTVGAVVALAWLMQQASLTQQLASMKAAQEIHRFDETELPVNSWTRLDLPVLVGKWLGTNPTEGEQLLMMAALLAIPCVLLWRGANTPANSGLTSIGGSLAAIGVLVSIYHQSYDALLALTPIVGIATVSQRSWRNISLALRVPILLLSLIPLFNVTSTQQFLTRLGIEGVLFQVVTSVNGAALLCALALLCVAQWQANRRA